MGMGSRFSRFTTAQQTIPHRPVCRLLLAALLLFGVPAQATVVYLAGSANPTFNLRFTELLQRELGDDAEIRPYDSPVGFEGPRGPVITLGQAALGRVLEGGSESAILALMVSRSFVDAVTSDPIPNLSALFYDPPLLRQALIGRAILPQASRMAMLATTQEADEYDPLIRKLASVGIEARVFLVSGDDALIPTLNRALSFGDFLLATPNQAIYNARTIKHILLTTYRRNRLVIGPGHAFVRAGVLASSYVPLEDYIREVARYIHQWERTGHMPASSYPESFDIEINRQVARSLNIPLPDNQRIVEDVTRMLQQIESGGGL